MANLIKAYSLEQIGNTIKEAFDTSGYWKYYSEKKMYSSQELIDLHLYYVWKNDPPEMERTGYWINRAQQLGRLQPILNYVPPIAMDINVSEGLWNTKEQKWRVIDLGIIEQLIESESLVYKNLPDRVKIKYDLLNTNPIGEQKRDFEITCFDTGGDIEQATRNIIYPLLEQINRL